MLAVHTEGVLVVDSLDARQARDAMVLDMRDSNHRVGDAPLLTAEEEVDLSKKIELGMSAKKTLEGGQVDGQPLTASQKRLFRRRFARGEAARNQMVESNLRLVQSHLGRLTVPAGASADDLFQEGALALHRAAERFDWRKGYKFSTFASPWIRQAFMKALNRSTATVSATMNVKDQMRVANRVAAELTVAGVSPSEEDVADRMGMTVERLREIQAMSRAVVSLDAPVAAHTDEGSALTVGDTVASPTTEQDLQAAELRTAGALLQDLLDDLPEDERRAVLLRASEAQIPRGEAKAVTAAARRGISRLRHPSQPLSHALTGFRDPA